ncbi:MAG: sigma-70 family RNA polymerase sigma factor [Clostridia bacterium]|nr:sigma-70 family RNA polymerase sigma factor [Clostridia bacterium]
MDDAELLSELRASPNDGLRRLVFTYEQLLYSVVRGVLRRASDADVEECVSDVFTDFYLALDRYDPSIGSIKAYLCVMAKNKALLLLRSSARRSTEDLERADEEADDGVSAEEAYLTEHQRRELARTVRDLGPPDNEIIFRKYYLGESSAAIASALGISENNVNVRTHRALKKLRKCFVP